MKYTTKRDLLLRELIGVLDQSELCRKKIQEKAKSLGNGWYATKCEHLQKIFRDMREKLQRHSVDHPLTKTDISDFKQKLKKQLDFPYRDNNDRNLYFGDVISEEQSFFAQLVDKFIYAMRAMLRCFDWFFYSTEPRPRQQSLFQPESYNEGGETVFALRLTGHSQFFPRPIHSLYNAQKALDSIMNRLENAYIGMEWELRLGK